MDAETAKPNSFKDFAETWVKQLATTAVAVSACGFLIVSLQEAQYGFISANPFRSKIASAGFLFLIFLAVPVAAGYLAAGERDWDKTSLIAGFSRRLLLLLLNTELAFGGVQLLLPLSRASLHSSIPQQVLYMCVTIPFFLQTSNLSVLYKAKIFIVFAIAGLGAAIAQVVVLRSEKDFLVAISWITLVSSVTFAIRFLLAQIPWNYMLNPTFITAPLFVLFCFAKWVYPTVGQEWGGGRLIKVQLYLNKDAVFPNHNVDKFLIDEIEGGVYVTDSPSGNAQFVPRSTISLMTYVRPNDRLR